MGVPSMFRWLSQKYPKIISRVKEELPREINGTQIPVDTTAPNPEGEEFDNLYLDMNGIVHPCSHPEDKDPPATEEEMMFAVFEYTERVVNMVRPRKILMLAVDGVAPRAKMNQQRQRRFRSAKEAAEKAADKEEFAKLVKGKDGWPSEESQSEKKAWDSNVITPGTPFMDMLAKSLRWWVSMKQNTDPMWAGLKVIISDASVPGEGEHKIMDFIRSQRKSKFYDPNTRHVIYGLDADLIMLALATHEPHFRVLREDVFFNKEMICSMCQLPGHRNRECPGPGNSNDNLEELVKRNLKPYMWLHVSVLREYLAEEMQLGDQHFKFDLERAIDDWVFMCFFVGNDFLPHLPSLEIREGGIDKLLSAWRETVLVNGDYVTKDGELDIYAVNQIMSLLAKEEPKIFRDRKKEEERFAARQAGRNGRNGPNGTGPGSRKRGPDDTQTQPYKKRVRDSIEQYRDIPVFSPQDAQSNQTRNAYHNLYDANRSAAAALKQQMQGASQTPKQGSSQTPNQDSSQTPKQDEDTVKLWEPGYADRYYVQKFGVRADDRGFRQKVACAYAEGLAWVLQYYMQGCVSWTWYYPYHYAPFAADFKIPKGWKPEFSLGEPFKPYQQLMGVLPAASRHAVPEAYHPLMTDPDSKIYHFYPENFEIDLNGAKQAWKGVALLPFIDEDLLKGEMAEKDLLLNEEEIRRNTRGPNILLFSDAHPLYQWTIDNIYGTPSDSEELSAPEDMATAFQIEQITNLGLHPPTIAGAILNPDSSDGLFGHVRALPTFVPHSILEFPFENRKDEFPEIPDQRTMALAYMLPKDVEADKHESKLLAGTKPPKPVLTDEDKEQVMRQARNRGNYANYNGHRMDVLFKNPNRPNAQTIPAHSVQPFWNLTRRSEVENLRPLHLNYSDQTKISQLPEPNVPKPDGPEPGHVNVEALFPHIRHLGPNEQLPEGDVIFIPQRYQVVGDTFSHGTNVRATPYGSEGRRHQDQGRRDGGSHYRPTYHQPYHPTRDLDRPRGPGYNGPLDH